MLRVGQALAADSNVAPTAMVNEATNATTAPPVDR